MSDVAIPTTFLQERDIRSASKSYKRDKDHGQKWAYGQRPSAGVRINYCITSPDSDHLVGGSEEQRAKVRPMKPWSQINSDLKSHANKSPKNNISVPYDQDQIHGRITKKAEATLESKHPESLSKSLLALMPQHKNNTELPVQLAGDEGILYSFEKRSSPNARGREVDLGGLVEQAERKWAEEQTEKMVKGEYEVLDLSGEAVTGKKKKTSRSPKSRAQKVETPVEEVDGFELV